MSFRQSLARMQGAVLEYIRKNRQTDTASMSALRGTIMGKRVVIGGKSYAYDPAVDTYFPDGSQVYCVMDETGTMAVIVGD